MTPTLRRTQPIDTLHTISRHRRSAADRWSTPAASRRNDSTVAVLEQRARSPRPGGQERQLDLEQALDQRQHAREMRGDAPGLGESPRLRRMVA